MSADISFNGQIISEGAFSSLLHDLTNETEISSLDLSGTNTVGLRLMMIASALKGNTTLQSLRLGRNSMKQEEVETLVDALLGTNIVFLDLSQSLIDIHTINPIKRLIQQSTKLQFLDVSGNLWGDRATEVIEALREGNALTSVDLSGNQISDAGIQVLVSVIESNWRLTKVFTELVCDGEDCAPAIHPDVLVALRH